MSNRTVLILVCGIVLVVLPVLFAIMNRDIESDDAATTTHAELRLNAEKPLSISDLRTALGPKITLEKSPPNSWIGTMGVNRHFLIADTYGDGPNPQVVSIFVERPFAGSVDGIHLGDSRAVIVAKAHELNASPLINECGPSASKSCTTHGSLLWGPKYGSFGLPEWSLEWDEDQNQKITKLTMRDGKFH